MSTPPPNNRRRPNSVPPPREPEADECTPLPGLEVDAVDASVRSQAVSPERAPFFAPGTGRKIMDRARRTLSLLSMAAVLAGSAVGGRAAHRWVTHSPRFGARQIDVVGNSRTRAEEILAAAHIAEGTNVLGLDTLRAERAVEELPWVEHAHVSRRLPGYVRVEVEERTAVATVAAGGMYLCAGDGTLFKRAQTGDPDDLPVITGIARGEFERDPDAARENVRDALALLADVAASSLAGRARVDEVHREPTGDLSVVLSGRGTYVWLGRGGYRAKMARLSVILNELDRLHIEPAEIHLESDRHPERATVRVPVAAPAQPGIPAAR